MKAVISSATKTIPAGKISAISSKSAAHRLLICAAFADRETSIRCDYINRDIEATVDCLTSLGAKITRESPFYRVTPVKNIIKNASLNCHESGSTLRFLLPIVAALGVDCDFYMAGRLPFRPLSPLREELEEHGIALSEAGSNPLSVRGKLSGDSFKIAGNISSQFISGLLFALTFRGKKSTLTVEGRVESAPYIDMTADALSLFSAMPEIMESCNGYKIKQDTRLVAPDEISVEGDWSNAAFPLAAGALSSSPLGVTVCGLDMKSRQGDRAIVEILERFGAKIDISYNGDVTVKGGKLQSIDIDASQIPDLVPILAVVASVAEGKTKIFGAARLRAKESDRLRTITEMLSALGADITETDDGLIICGKPHLKGGTVSSAGDHRIAMSAAIASAVCQGDVVIDGADAVNKSYPTFWHDIKNIKIHPRIL